jgi:hypothetical protein
VHPSSFEDEISDDRAALQVEASPAEDSVSRGHSG